MGCYHRCFLFGPVDCTSKWGICTDKETVWGISQQKRVHNLRPFYWMRFFHPLMFVMRFSDLCKRMDRQIMMVIDSHALNEFATARLELLKHSFSDLGLLMLFGLGIWFIWAENSQSWTYHSNVAFLFSFFCDFFCCRCWVFFIGWRGSFIGWSRSWFVCRRLRRVVVWSCCLWRIFLGLYI